MYTVLKSDCYSAKFFVNVYNLKLLGNDMHNGVYICLNLIKVNHRACCSAFFPFFLFFCITAVTSYAYIQKKNGCRTTLSAFVGNSCSLCGKFLCFYFSDKKKIKIFATVATDSKIIYKQSNSLRVSRFTKQSYRTNLIFHQFQLLVLFLFYCIELTI